MLMVFMGVASSFFAQEQGERFIVGTKEIFHSKILDEDRNVYVFLPDGYSGSDENYPVLYMLYSEAPDFHFNINIGNSFSLSRKNFTIFLR